MRSYNIDLRHTFLISSSEVGMEIDEFARYVEENKIENIFWADPLPEFIEERGITLKFPDSRFFIIFHGQTVFLTDSWGYWTISKFLESRNNKIFYAINRLKKEFSNHRHWKASVGHMYDRIEKKGYRTEEELEKSVKFFSGYIESAKSSKMIMEYAKKGEFRNISELIISERSGFINVSDYIEAKDQKIPDMATLNSFRLIEELMALGFKNRTEALLFAVLLRNREQLKDKGQSGTPRIEIREVFYELLEFMPDAQNSLFKKITNPDEIKNMILDRTAYSLLGFYNRSTNSFDFKEENIYVDGSNIVHNGTKGGEENRNQKDPDITYLKECLLSLNKIGIVPMGIYMDSETVRAITNSSKQSKEEYVSICESYNVTPSLINEKADERLIQKLKDDPNCFVITNDSYDKYNLIDSERRRLIAFERLGSDYKFNMGSGLEIADYLKIKGDNYKKYLDIIPMRNVGTWPFGESFDSLEIQTFSANILKKLGRAD